MHVKRDLPYLPGVQDSRQFYATDSTGQSSMWVNMRHADPRGGTAEVPYIRCSAKCFSLVRSFGFRRLASTPCLSSVSEPKHPDDAALRHIGLRAEELVEPRLHSLGIDTPSGLHRDVLHAVDHV